MSNMLPSKRSLRSLLYILLVVTPSLFTGVFCQNILNTFSHTTTTRSINTLTNYLETQLSQYFNTIDYNLILLSSAPSFQELNTTAITKQLDLLKYYNQDVYANLYVFNANYDQLYGISLPQDVNIQKQTYISDALEGNRTYHYSLENNKVILKFAYPIYSPTNIKEVTGVIACVINVSSITDILHSISALEDTIDCYIVDDSGVIISSSLNGSLTGSQDRIDLYKIKTSIDYDSTLPFENEKQTQSIGNYFELSPMNWTVIVSREVDGLYTNNMNIIGFLSALFGTGGITTLEVARKKKSSNNANTPSPKDSTFNKEDTPPKTTDSPIGSDPLTAVLTDVEQLVVHAIKNTTDD